MEIKEFKLVPVKSHYGKAKVRVYGNTGVYSLVSYGTEVAAGKMATKDTPAAMYRIYDWAFDNAYGGWSLTTFRHLESFAAFLGCQYKGKKDWTAKQYVTMEEVIKSVTTVAA